MRGCKWFVTFAGALVVCAGAMLSGAGYPATLIVDASAKGENATVTSSLTIRVDRLIDDVRRTRVLDALRYNGYSGFLNTLRPLDVLGKISLGPRSVDLRYAYETPTDNGRRLVLVADRPLFFISSDAAKSRAGYELTVIELRLDASGRGKGTMAGAARVKPAGDGEVSLADYADVPVDLTVRSITP